MNIEQRRTMWALITILKIARERCETPPEVRSNKGEFDAVVDKAIADGEKALEIPVRHLEQAPELREVRTAIWLHAQKGEPHDEQMLSLFQEYRVALLSVIAIEGGGNPKA
jgi:hypothetical protein